MLLPADYRDIVARGVAALRVLEARLRADAEARPSEPALWLTVRDVAAMADRLECQDEYTWRTGFAQTAVLGRDFVILVECAPLAEAIAADRDGAGGVHASSPYRDEPAASLRVLHDFLHRYANDAFEFEDPTFVPTRVD